MAKKKKKRVVSTSMSLPQKSFRHKVDTQRVAGSFRHMHSLCEIAGDKVYGTIEIQPSALDFHMLLMQQLQTICYPLRSDTTAVFHKSHALYITSYKDDHRYTGNELGRGQVVIDTPTPHLAFTGNIACLLYTSPSPRDRTRSRMPSSA